MTPSEDMRKFSLIIESVEFKNGVYCCCNPSQETKDAIKSFCAAYDVPNPLSAKDLHPQPKHLAYRDWETDRKSTRLNSSHITRSRMPSSA